MLKYLSLKEHGSISFSYNNKQNRINTINGLQTLHCSAQSQLSSALFTAGTLSQSLLKNHYSHE